LIEGGGEGLRGGGGDEAVLGVADDFEGAAGIGHGDDGFGGGEGFEDGEAVGVLIEGEIEQGAAAADELGLLFLGDPGRFDADTVGEVEGGDAGLDGLEVGLIDGIDGAGDDDGGVGAHECGGFDGEVLAFVGCDAADVEEVAVVAEVGEAFGLPEGGIEDLGLESVDGGDAGGHYLGVNEEVATLGEGGGIGGAEGLADAGAFEGGGDVLVGGSPKVKGAAEVVDEPGDLVGVG
jgi:hypothetical protein